MVQSTRIMVARPRNTKGFTLNHLVTSLITHVTVLAVHCVKPPPVDSVEELQLLCFKSEVLIHVVFEQLLAGVAHL
jgi:hypothetical protein